jgi:hypothetical protein
MLLGLLNSKLADWYFRLGSTNASVSHYQLYNLPAPYFDQPKGDKRELPGFTQALNAQEYGAAFKLVEALLAAAPFATAVMTCMVRLVERITASEANRGAIARSERSALAPEAQPYQDLIDRILYRMAGLTDAEAAGLEKRLATML